MKKIMGIDADSHNVGWFVAHEDRGDRSWGMIRLGKGSFDERFLRAIAGVKELIGREKPDIVAIEQPYLGLNVQTTIKLAKMVGMIYAMAWLASIEVIEFQPSEGKASLSGRGSATDDEMVDAMWMTLLGISSASVNRNELNPHVAHAMGGFEYAKAKLWERSLEG